jgi:hypothetical protein
VRSFTAISFQFADFFPLLFMGLIGEVLEACDEPRLRASREYARSPSGIAKNDI